MRSLELATDRLVMIGASTFERHPDRTVQRTPAEPNFWFGNRVIFDVPPDNAEAALAQFHSDLPEARHVCLSWDVPNLPLDEVDAVFEGHGLTIEQGDVLALKGPIRRSAAPEGIVLRPLGDADWIQSEDIGFADAQDGGMPLEGYRDYLVQRDATRRTQIASGLGQWFGAFEGDLLVGDMGIFHDAALIRYQSVQTRKSHRRRGICSALLCHALDWAQSCAPEAVPVIVADADSDAGRIYRKAGFVLAETIVSAYRGPK